MSKRQIRDFFQRDLAEQQAFQQYTWCDHCAAADLGMDNPVEYCLDGTVYVEGICRQCGHPVITEVDDD